MLFVPQKCFSSPPKCFSLPLKCFLSPSKHFSIFMPFVPFYINFGPHEPPKSLFDEPLREKVSICT